MRSSVIIEKRFYVWTNSQLVCIFCKILTPFFTSVRHFCSPSLSIPFLGSFEMNRPYWQCTDRSTRIEYGAIHEHRMSEISLTYEVVNELSEPIAQLMSFKLSRFTFEQKTSGIIFCWKQLEILLLSCTLFILQCEETDSVVFYWKQLVSWYWLLTASFKTAQFKIHFLIHLYNVKM